MIKKTIKALERLLSVIFNSILYSNLRTLSAKKKFRRDERAYPYFLFLSIAAVISKEWDRSKYEIKYLSPLKTQRGYNFTKHNKKSLVRKK